MASKPCQRYVTNSRGICFNAQLSFQDAQRVFHNGLWGPYRFGITGSRFLKTPFDPENSITGKEYDFLNGFLIRHLQLSIAQGTRRPSGPLGEPV